MYVFSFFFSFLFSFVFQIFKFYLHCIYSGISHLANTYCFQILIARVASSTAKNANGYDSLSTHLLSYVLQFSNAFSFDSLFIY